LASWGWTAGVVTFSATTGRGGSGWAVSTFGRGTTSTLATDVGGGELISTVARIGCGDAGGVAGRLGGPSTTSGVGVGVSTGRTWFFFFGDLPATENSDPPPAQCLLR